MSNELDVQNEWEQNTHTHTHTLTTTTCCYTTSAVSPTRKGAHEKTYGMRNRRRNVYASLEVWIYAFLARLPKHNNRPRCLRPSTVRCLLNSGIHAPHLLDLWGVVIKPPKPPILLNFEHLKHLGPCRQRPLSTLE